MRLHHLGIGISSINILDEIVIKEMRSSRGKYKIITVYNTVKKQ